MYAVAAGFVQFGEQRHEGVAPYQRAVGGVEYQHVDARVGKILRMLADHVRVVVAVEAVEGFVPVDDVVRGPRRMLHVVFRFGIFGKDLGEIAGRAAVSVAVAPGPVEDAHGLFARCGRFGGVGQFAAQHVGGHQQVVVSLAESAHRRLGDNVIRAVRREFKTLDVRVADGLGRDGNIVGTGQYLRHLRPGVLQLVIIRGAVQNEFGHGRAVNAQC